MSIEGISLFALALDEIASISKDVIVSVATIVGAYVAIKGINAWYREHTGKAEYEVARRWLRAVYSLRDAISSVREPLITSQEFVEASKFVENGKAGVIIENEKESGLENVYRFRWIDVRQAMSEMSAESLEAEVLWNETAKELQAKLIRLCNKLSYAIDDYLEFRRESDGSVVDKERLKEIRSIISRAGRSSSQSSFDAEIDLCIESCEIFIRPYLKSRFR